MNDLLQLFNESPDKYVSGEELSRKLKCSRTAVWKRINQLRKKGYLFEAVPNKGYRLLQTPERIDADALTASLATKVFGKTIRSFAEVDSTQSVAHQLAAQGAGEGTLVIAERQTAGRGRMGRTWFSPEGKGIWMSLLLQPKIPLARTPQLTLLTAVAVCRAIRRIGQVDAAIKWPNDILIDGKKVCGILLESVAEKERVRYVIAGIGISANFQSSDYPEDLRPIATSLLIASGKAVNRSALIAEVLAELEKLYGLYLQEGFAPIRTLWETLTVSLHRRVRINTAGGSAEGWAFAIDEAGALCMRMDNGETVRYFSGEIALA